MSADEARAIAGWRYPPPYDFYNGNDSRSADFVRSILRPDFNYFSVRDADDRLIAFRCFGTDARVSGGDYSGEALDMGGGIRPDHCGRGLGRHVLCAAMNFALDLLRPRWFRATVAAFNGRALKVCDQVGFAPRSEFVREIDGVAFVVLTKAAEAMDLKIPFEVGKLGSRQGSETS